MAPRSAPCSVTSCALKIPPTGLLLTYTDQWETIEIPASSLHFQDLEVIENANG